MKRNHTGENVTVQNDKYFVHQPDSAIHLAIRRGYHVELEKLLQNGAKPCFGEGDNCFILSDDNWEIILKLLQLEPRGVRATNWEGGTVLSNNIRHLDRVKYLISIGSDPLENMHTSYEEYNSSSETVMEFAVAEAPIEVLEYLLDIGTLARTDRIIHKGDHLSKAIHTGDIEKVKLIMKAGVNSSHLQNIYSGHHSSNDFVKHPQILKLLHEDKPLDKKILNDILACAVASGKLPIINLVLQYGAEVSNNEFGKKLLIKSLRYPKIVKMLLEKGLDPNTVHNYGQTAVMLAAKEGLIITVRLLLEHGAHTNRRDRRGRTALMHGVHCPEAVKALLEHGADLSLKDRRGQTALIKAVRYPNSVKHILEYGANVQVADYNGNTALMKAVPYPDSVKVLLENGALPWIMNEEGRNALNLTLKYYEFPPKHSSGEILTNDDVSTIELLLDIACDDNVLLGMYDEQCLFDIYMDCYDDGVFSDEEDNAHHSSDDSDEEMVWGFKAGYYRPPFLNILVEKGFVARLAGILAPKFLTTILLNKMCINYLILDAEQDTFSPVTSLLLARLHFSNFDTTITNLKILLLAGTNVGQRLLEFCDRQMFEISKQLQVPDCLLLALMLGKSCKYSYIEYFGSNVDKPVDNLQNLNNIIHCQAEIVSSFPFHLF
jgi:ankyrin repeat protein